MKLEPFVTQLRQDLATATDSASPEVAEAAARLVRSLEPALRLVLLEAVGSAVAELNGALAERADTLGALVTADLRLRGRDPEVVLDVTGLGAPEPEAGRHVNADSAVDAGQPFEVDDDGNVTRVTLRLPEGLKSMIDSAAGVAGTSLNSYVARTLADALRGGLTGPQGPFGPPPPSPPGAPTSRRSGSKVRGWVR